MSKVKANASRYMKIQQLLISTILFVLVIMALACMVHNHWHVYCSTNASILPFYDVQHFTKTANKMQHTIGRSLLHFVSHETLFDINLFNTKLQHIEYKIHVRANHICTLVEYYFVLLAPSPSVKRTNCANWSNVYIGCEHC